MLTALPYPKALFDLQLTFAETVGAMAGLTLARAVLDYTNLYIRFGLGREFDPAHPVWQRYVSGLGTAHDAREWTYRFYATLAPAVAPPALVATSGCFSYGRLAEDRIRLHFHDADGDGRSPLSSERRGRRRAELAALFEHVRRHENERVRVVGASWLYNLSAYRRLFPETYVTTARVLHGRFRHMPLWGQFIDRGGALRQAAAGEFLSRLSRQSSVDDLDDCFPLQVLGLEAPAPVFYDYYGV